MAETQTVGETVTLELKGQTLIISVDLTHRGSVSPSGKTRRVASTLGNARVEGSDAILGLNVYVKV